MNRRSKTCGFKGGFFPSELKSTHPLKSPEPQNTESTNRWQGSSDREESLSDPQWHKKPPAKGKILCSKKQSHTESVTQVQDAREPSYKKRRKPGRSPTFQKSFLAIIRKHNRPTRRRKRRPRQRKSPTQGIKNLPNQTQNHFYSHTKKPVRGTEIGR